MWYLNGMDEDQKEQEQEQEQKSLMKNKASQTFQLFIDSGWWMVTLFFRQKSLTGTMIEIKISLCVEELLRKCPNVWVHGADTMFCGFIRWADNFYVGYDLICHCCLLGSHWHTKVLNGARRRANWREQKREAIYTDFYVKSKVSGERPHQFQKTAHSMAVATELKFN